MKTMKIMALIAALMLPFAAAAQQGPSLKPMAPHMSRQMNQPKCGPKEGLVEYLGGEKFKEAAFFLGVVNPELVMELYLNKETQTWTAFVTNIQGISCLFGSGTGFEITDPPLSE